MTVATTVSKSGPYAGAGTVGPFTVGFRFLENEHLQVIRTSTIGIDTTLVLDTGYTVAGAGGSSGSVTLAAALAVGEKLTIIRNVPATQEADYVQNDAFPAESHERALDKLTMLVQQQGEVLGRSLTLPATVVGTSTELPTPASSMLIGWNAAADGLENVNATLLATIVAFGSANADVFTGDGVTTAFGLSASPATLGNLDVAVGGVTQTPGVDYTYAGGTVLTFTTAPVNGVTILARYQQGLPAPDTPLRTELAAPGGAALVGFSHAQTYAAGTLGAKGSQSISVKDAPFNAVGDGVTDDTAAIQAAINFIKTIGGGVVEFPIGTYLISAPLNIIGNFQFNGIELRGHRATINASHNGIAFFSKPAGVDSADAAPEYRQNTLIHGLTIQGPGKANTSAVGVQIQQGANVQVRDCTIQGFYRGLHGVGALICNFHNLLIQDNDFGIDMIRTTPTGAAYDPQFGPNDVHFYDCQVIDNIKAVRCLEFPNGVISFHGCEIEGNNLAGTTTDGVRVLEFFDAGKVAFFGCHLEENPGEFNLYFHGENANCHLSLIGCEIIPGNSCANCVYLDNASGAANAANAFIAGTRIINGVGNQLFIANGFKVTVIGEIEGLISGSLDKLTYIRGGRVISGARESAFAQAKFVGDGSGIALDLQGVMRFVDGAGARQGYFGNNGSSTYMLSDVGSALVGTNGGIRVEVARLGTATFEPAVDNTYQLGTASLRWGTVYAGTGTINTSDAREKQKRKEGIDPAVFRAWAKVNFTQFKWNAAVQEKGDAARWHFGFIAQEVKEAFESEGLDPFAFGILCYDEWPDQYVDELDESQTPTGNQVLKVAAGNRYGIRYDEALALECAYLRSR